MTRFFALVVVGLLAVPATAQYYARGTFGDPANDMITPGTDPWNDLTHQMVDQGGGHYTATVGDSNTYFPGVGLDYKLANADYSTQAPISGNGRVVTDNNGEVNFNLWTNNGDPWTDGWYPNNGPRAGYQDPQQFGWEVIGSFNDWRQLGTDPAYSMTDMGNGLYTTAFTLDAGNYNFKFREQDSWDVSIGSDFSNTAPDNKIRVWDDGETWTFSLDLPNGRWQAVSSTPTPDLNNDGYVDATDYVLWRKSNGSIDQYNEWRKHFGETPPPPPPGWYARGDFNGWNTDNQLDDHGSGYYTGTITGLTPGTAYEYKIARSDWSESAPGSNGKVPADANGEIHFYYWENTPDDQWSPTTGPRVGFDDPGQFGWELMGDYGTNFASLGSMTDQGGGLYSIDVNLATADTFQFKFREQDDWSISIGADFGNSAANATFDVPAAGMYEFDLDLPNGRWRVIPVSGSGSSFTSTAVPEPASVALAMLGLAFLGLCRRKP